MGKTLTIVAERLGRDPQDPDEEDSSIKSIMDHFNTLQDPSHVIMRASTVARVKEGLDHYHEQHDPHLDSTDLIQIIGHGSAGLLWLAGSWLDGAMQTAAGEKLVIDSNPNWYSILLRKIKPKKGVLLIGCAVGAENRLSEDIGRLGDGPTLLFDLARMWRCVVKGPTKWAVTAADMVNGTLGPNVPLHRADGTGETDVSNVEDVGGGIPFVGGIGVGPHGPVGPSIRIGNVLGVPAIGMIVVPKFIGPQGKLDKNPLSVRPGSAELPLADPRLTLHLKSLTSAVGLEVDGRRLLAGPELALHVLFDGQPAVGDLICNFRVLRVQTTIGMRYFQLKPDQRDAVLGIVRSIIRILRP